MSANYLVDLQNTAVYCPSLSVVTLSGAMGQIGQWVDLRNCDSYCNIYVAAGACSGPIQVQVQVCPGPFDIPATNGFSGNIFSGGIPQSGSFTDPTSGLPQLPTTFTSGTILTVNSGLYTVPGALGASGQLVNNYTQGTIPFGTNPIQQGMGGFGQTSGSAPVFTSGVFGAATGTIQGGGIAFAAFQRPYQYARINLISGATIPPYVQAGFISQSLTTGSGGGVSQQPFSPTTVNV